MNKLILLPNLFFLLLINSCTKEIKSEQGSIDIISNVYFDASKSLDKVQNFHVSRINYSGDSIIELVPNSVFPQQIDNVYYIKDSIFFPLPINSLTTINLAEKIAEKNHSSVKDKHEGALFTKEEIPNYKNRKNLPDTILFKKNYKRFEVNSPWSYTRFYIHPTDTILPYSIYRHAEIDYKGRLERIDTYNRKKDIFISLQLIPKKTWDTEAKEIFDFNNFLKSKNRDQR